MNEENISECLHQHKKMEELFELISKRDAGKLTEKGTNIRTKIWNIADTMELSEMEADEFQIQVKHMLTPEKDGKISDADTKRELIRCVLMKMARAKELLENTVQ